MMKLIDPFAVWIQTTHLAFLMKANPWLWAFCETVHFLGLAMMVGAIGTLDLRMLGVAKQIPMRPLHRLVPWGIAGFVANLTTGTIPPTQYNTPTTSPSNSRCCSSCWPG
jgi:hypothetical protein